MDPRPPDDDLLLAALRLLLLPPLRREAEDEFAVDLAELAVEAATGGIPLAAAAAAAAEGAAGLAGRFAAGYSRSIREDSLAAPTPIEREGEKGDYERAGKMSGKDRE